MIIFGMDGSNNLDTIVLNSKRDHLVYNEVTKGLQAIKVGMLHLQLSTHMSISRF